jgi:outer membrane protein assembly factor BamB
MALRVRRPGSGMAPPPRAAIVLALLLATTAIDSRADDVWPGFRGQERQGVGPGAQAPLRWSASEHVRWKTPIPGAGHSSPVVAGDQVFVTTAYQSATARQAARGARGARLALALLVLSAAFLLPRTATWWHDALLAPALAAFVVLAVGDERLLQFERSAARAWLGAMLAVLAGLVIGAYGDPPSSRRRRILALTVAALGAILVIGLPDGPRQSRPLQGAVLAVAAAAAAAALLLWRGLFAGSRPGSPLGQGAAAIVIVAVVVTFRPLVGAATVWLTVAAVTIGMVARAWFGARPRLAGPWRSGVLATAVVGFAATAILVPRSGWIHAVVAIDRESGRTRWITEGLTAARTAVHHANSMATPTAVAGAGRVIAWFGSPGLMAVDSGGRLLWTNRTVPFQSMYGVGASPVLGAASVLVAGFTADGAYLAAYDPATGDERWRTPRAAVHAEFGDSRTPLLVAIGGRPTVVAWGIDALAGHDADTGRVLWTYPHGANQRMGSMVASIVAEGDRLFLPLENGMLALSAARLAAGGDPVVWTSRGGASALATPVLYQGRIYAVSAAGIASCIDAGSGAILWRQRLAGAYRSSPVAVAGHVYFTDETGRTTVVAAEPVFRVVAQNDIGEPVVATLAPVGGAFYIRGQHHLFRVGP